MSDLSLPPLTIWAHTLCRSTLATYLALARDYGTDVEIIICGNANPKHRKKAGFSASEFPMAQFVALEPSTEDALELLKARPDRLHMFAAYHGTSLAEALLDQAVAMGAKYFIASEAPQNMEKSPLRRVAKEVWVPTLLRWRVRRSVANSLFFVCYSGEAPRRLHQVGWPDTKIEPFGYYPPSLSNARPKLDLPARPDATRDAPLQFLATGIHDDHKSPVTLVEAAAILKQQGIAARFRCTIAGSGKQTEAMKRAVARDGLPVDFSGFVSLEKLIQLYRGADVFVGTDVDEPWGIRINDAILLGCPVICSTGMGAHTDILRYKLGWAFDSGSAEDLARLMRRLIEDRGTVLSVNQFVAENTELSPDSQAQRLRQIIERRLCRRQAA